jgi:hypothetical protein
MEAADMWTYSPTLVVIVGTITLVLVLWGHTWFDKQRREGEGYTCVLVLMGRNLFHAVFAFAGLFLIDAVLRICFSSVVSFGSFTRYALASVILCSVLGIMLILGTVFITPTWKTLAVFFVMLGSFLFVTISSFSGAGQVEFEDLLYVIATGAGLEAILDIVDLVVGFAKKKKKGEKVNILKDSGSVFSPPLWDLSLRFKKIMNVKVYLVLFAFFCAELILLFEGMSLLSWL